MELDYEKVGLKCGLEIHQQLDTKKLFCNCPSILRKQEQDFIVMRRLHAVAGETGETDVAAKFQTSLGKEFLYQGYNDTTCLVELDESPPREINQEALQIALQISLLLHAEIIPLAQIMRKTVVDGSNTSGFQRTVIIAHGGYVETTQGKVGIDSICIEEDSARIIFKNEKEAVYRLDRLGIPLIEIATSPDIKTPEQAKEVALHLGSILRSCKVKRGIGTIRQDVNVSIKKGERVEIKGFQDIMNIERAIEFEVKRQIELIKKRKSIPEVRKVLPDGKTDFLRPLPGEARMYPETDLPLLKISRNLINEAKKTLPKQKHKTEKELKEKGLTPELIKLVLEGHLNDFEVLLKIYPKDSQLVAKMLTLWRRELATKLNKEISKVNEKINIDVMEKLLQEVKKGNLEKNHIKPVLAGLMKGDLLKDLIKKEKIDEHEFEEKVLKILKEKPGLSEKAYMGLIMKEFRGKISGKEAMEIIKKHNQ